VFVGSNAVLKLKFQKLHVTVVDSVNAANIIDFLFQENVLGAQDLHTLHQRSDPKQQCRDLLTLLHTSENPQAFIHLYSAIKKESHLDWLIDRIDKYSDQSLIDVLRQLYISDQTGKCYSEGSQLHPTLRVHQLRNFAFKMSNAEMQSTNCNVICSNMKRQIN